MKRLSENYNMNEEHSRLEEELWDENIIIDKGFYLEVYGNPDGKYDEESSNGASCFVYIDQDVTYKQLLEFSDDLGRVKDDTLTIRIVGIDEELERGMCLENKISKYI